MVAPATLLVERQQQGSNAQQVAGTQQPALNSRTGSDLTPVETTRPTGCINDDTSIVIPTVDAVAILQDTRRLLRQPVALLSDVVGGVLVVLEQGRDGLIHGETRYQGVVRGWSCTELSRTQIRELAAHARALHRVGEDGRKGPAAVYDSVAS